MRLFSKVDKILQIYFSTSGVNAIREPHTEVRPLSSAEHLAEVELGTL